MTTHACRVCAGSLEILECEVRKCHEEISLMESKLFMQRSQVVLGKIRAKNCRECVLTGTEAEEKPWLKLGSKPPPEVAEAELAKEIVRMERYASRLQKIFEKRRQVQAERDNAQIAYLCCTHRYV